MKPEQSKNNSVAPINGTAQRKGCGGQRTNEEKIAEIAHYFGKIMEVLGLDLENPSLRETPKRVAKMYVNEIFLGLDKTRFPQMSFFENDYQYDEMVIVNNITLYSYCEHHFVPFIGKVNVGYFPNKKVIGLSKINRIVDFLAKKPQVQERLCGEIALTLSKILGTGHIAVHIQATHLCVASRGAKDHGSGTKTGTYLGKFKNEYTKREFMSSFQ